MPLSKAINKCDNGIVMGCFNMDITKKDCSIYDKLEEFCDKFNLKNLIKSKTYYTNDLKLTNDLFLTNKPLYIQGTSYTETGVSNFHKFMSIFIRSFVFRLKPKNNLFSKLRKV